MKKPVYLIICAFLLSVCSCRRDKCCVIPEPPARITAEKNGVAWSPRFAKGVLSEIDSLSISATGITEQVYPYKKIDTLNISILYNKPGIYPLQGSQAFYGIFKDNGLTGYRLDASYNNVINITGYERLSNPYSSAPDQVRITGTFSLRFINPNDPLGISFRNGSFYTLVPY
ncbi:MAG: hypothetical protein JST19_01170 [Bacteroidetes bacterium]|nr:hypothetical protein [Bacteroidota bacterium]